MGSLFLEMWRQTKKAVTDFDCNGLMINVAGSRIELPTLGL